MVRYTVTVLINTTFGSRFEQYRGDAVMATVSDALTFHVQANSPAHAAEAVFVIGNRMATDLNAKAWPAWVRSMSVGDVVQVLEDVEFGPGFGRGLWACDQNGWVPAKVTPAQVRHDHTTPTGRQQMVETGDAAEED